MGTVVRLRENDPVIQAFSEAINVFAGTIDALDPYTLKRLVAQEESQEAIRTLRKASRKLSRALGDTPKFPEFPK